MEPAEKKYKTNDRRRETALAYYYNNKTKILEKAKARYEAKVTKMIEELAAIQPQRSVLNQLNTASSNGHLSCHFS